MKHSPSSQSLLVLAAPSSLRRWAPVTASPRRTRPNGGIAPSKMADALFAVMQADRTVYSNEVVYRLQDVEEVIEASEHWDNQKALPLPAQMFRMGAGLVAKQTDAFSYALLSKWPLNKESVPRPRWRHRAGQRRREPVKALLRPGDHRRRRVLHRGLCRRRRLAVLREVPQRPRGQSAGGLQAGRRHGRCRYPHSVALTARRDGRGERPPEDESMVRRLGIFTAMGLALVSLPAIAYGLTAGSTASRYRSCR